MILNLGETKQDKYNSGTYDGIVLNVNLTAAAANTQLGSAAFNPSMVAVKVVLKRKGRTMGIFNDNLLLLGTYNTLKKGYHEFANGIDKVYPVSGVKHKLLKTVKLNFGGHLRITNDDLLLIEITMPSGSFGSTVDSSQSHVEFYATPSIGYEMFVPTTVCEVVQASAPSQPFNPGNNIIKLAFLNFDKNTLENEVISSLNLSSDRWDSSFTFNQLLAHNVQNFDEMPNARYGSTLPIDSTGTGRAFRGLDYLPQSMVIFDGNKDSTELDDCRLNVAFNGSQVAASQNFFVWTTYEANLTDVQAAIEREQKHVVEKIQKTPTA